MVITAGTSREASQRATLLHDGARLSLGVVADVLECDRDTAARLVIVGRLMASDDLAIVPDECDQYLAGFLRPTAGATAHHLSCDHCALVEDAMAVGIAAARARWTCMPAPTAQQLVPPTPPPSRQPARQVPEPPPLPPPVTVPRDDPRGPDDPRATAVHGLLAVRIAGPEEAPAVGDANGSEVEDPDRTVDLSPLRDLIRQVPAVTTPDQVDAPVVPADGPSPAGRPRWLVAATRLVAATVMAVVGLTAALGGASLMAGPADARSYARGGVAHKDLPRAALPDHMTPDDLRVGDPYYTPTWDRLADCASGGDWSAAPDETGRAGGLAIGPADWRRVGGLGPVEDASRERQVQAGISLWELRGWSAWPACAEDLGLR